MNFVSKFRLRLKIRGRLITGFAILSGVLTLAVLITAFEVSQVRSLNGRIVTLRVPTAAASAKMINDINASLASLQGWMITGNRRRRWS